MYFSKTPQVIRPFAKDLLWCLPDSRKTIYLTFDDGPTPAVTEGVLDLLNTYQAKATFFCVGNQVAKYPDIFKSVLSNGHSVGNHTQNHLNGWKSKNIAYFKDYLECSKLVDSSFFRPPYGKISRSQATSIGKRSKIVMWDVLSGDFDVSSTPQDCSRRVQKHAQAGSIVVFHDSVKAEKNMFYSLEASLNHFSKQGYSFEALTTDLLS